MWLYFMKKQDPQKKIIEQKKKGLEKFLSIEKYVFQY